MALTDRAARLVWRGFGLTCVGLGSAGAVLPLLPTTPFLLLAAWAFAHSSPRWRRWLLTHPRLGPPIRTWQERRAVPRRAKAVAVLTLAGSVALAWAYGVPGWALALQLVAVFTVAAFLLTRPSG